MRELEPHEKDGEEIAEWGEMFESEYAGGVFCIPTADAGTISERYQL